MSVLLNILSDILKLLHKGAWPEVVGFASALIPSAGLNRLIVYYTRRRISGLRMSKEWKEALPVEEGWRMANLERVLYIWAVMSTHYELIAGWLVLKGFSEWAAWESDRAKLPVLTPKQWQGIYNSYLEGNALSIILGLVSGYIGIWIEGYLKVHR